jgi:uncharacterized protein (UPF0332 family)
MDPREFYHFARKLCSSGDPAELRCATGRAYYAAFNVAAAMLRGWGIPIVHNAAGHGEVLRCLGNSGDNDLVAVGHKLGTLRARRNVADYDLTAGDVEDSKTVRSLVETAGRLIDTMDRCLDPSRSTAIKSALDSYRRAIAPPPP